MEIDKRCIICEFRYDFYLVSSAAKQGTVLPTCYNVLYDSYGLPPATIQAFTYKFCHMYYNAK